jgi:hypothetical protein
MRPPRVRRDSRARQRGGNSPTSCRARSCAPPPDKPRRQPRTPSDPSLTDWRKAYYGDNRERLEGIKKTIDPDRLFAFPQAI